VSSLQQSGSGTAAKRADLSYNGLDQLTQVRRYADLAGASLIVASTYGYDGANRLTGLTHQNAANTVLASYTWDYTEANNKTVDRITSRTASADGGTAYTYDLAGQLTLADNTAQAD